MDDLGGERSALRFLQLDVADETESSPQTDSAHIQLKDHLRLIAERVRSYRGISFF